MNQEQLSRMKNDPGFVAALDQSGGSTPKALSDYGVAETEYSNEAEMFDRIYEMRERLLTSPAIKKECVLGAILFKSTMERQMEGKDTADYLWEEKGVVPFLKIDSGLAEEEGGVQLLKPMPDLDTLLDRAVEKHMFGTKMRSVIHSLNEEGIRAVVAQQFEVAKQIIAKGLVPIVEPEVDIHSPEKAEIEVVLERELKAALDALAPEEQVILKLTLPEVDNHYEGLAGHENVVRLLALSGGYSRDEANERLSRNHATVASFNRALYQGLSVHQSEEEFDTMLTDTVESIYEASIA